MKQFSITGNELVLFVKRAPIVILATFYLFGFLFFAFPVFFAINWWWESGRFYPGMLVVIGIFGLMGAYLLRLAIWNTSGKEIIHISEGLVTCQADYGRFHGKLRQLETASPQFEILQAGYEEDRTGILAIRDDQGTLETTVKLPLIELEEIVAHLKNNRSK